MHVLSGIFGGLGTKSKAAQKGDDKSKTDAVEDSGPLADTQPAGT